MIFQEAEDTFLLSCGKRFLQGKEHHILELLDERKFLSPESLKVFSRENLERRIVRIEKLPDTQAFYKQYDLIVVSLAFWKKQQGAAWLQDAPSLLIINR